MNKLVSIIIPSYNAEKWIKKTINSALSQTWRNKEIIIIDDGSTDNTFKIAKCFESDIVKVIRQENLGGSVARNKGLFYAQGDYIQWLDHDDLLEPDKIYNQLTNSKYEGNPKILLSGVFGKFYYRKEHSEYKPNPLWKDLDPIDYFLIKFTQNAWLHTTVWLVSRQLTDLAGPWYELKNPDDDGEYFCRIVAASEKINFVQDAISHFRVGNYNSMGHNRTDEALEALFISINKCIGHLMSLENSTRTREACLKFIQTHYTYFYPDKYELMAKCNNLAENYGGRLIIPTLSWKYSLIKNVLGSNVAQKTQRFFPMWRTQIQKKWDHLMYILSKKTN